MPSVVSTSVISKSLKPTLEKILTDKTDGVENQAVFPKYLKVSKMRDQFEDDLEVAGPGLAAEFDEGAEMPLGSIKEGNLFRYIAKKAGLKIIVTDEVREDGRYAEVYEAGRRCKRALWKTFDVDAALMLVRAEDTNYPFGDGQPLASASNPLVHGGTFSNLMATPMAPSRAAVIVADTAVMKMPDYDGVVTAMHKITGVVFPVDQKHQWKVVLKSDKAPEPGQFNAINTVSDMDIKMVPNVYWDTTTTNYCFLTSAEGGLSWRWKRKPSSKSWLDNDQELNKWGCSARWARGISNKRGIFFVGA